MYKGAIKPADNYNHYLSQRIYKIKIKKNHMYNMLDNPEKLLVQLNEKIANDEIRYKKNCEYLDKVFKIKENHE